MTITIETTDLERGRRSVDSLSLGNESFALTNSGHTRSTPLLSVSRRGGPRYRSVAVTTAEVPFAAFALLRPRSVRERCWTKAGL
jgi:hypothetical protein